MEYPCGVQRSHYILNNDPVFMAFLRLYNILLCNSDGLKFNIFGQFVGLRQLGTTLG